MSTRDIKRRLTELESVTITELSPQVDEALTAIESSSFDRPVDDLVAVCRLNDAGNRRTMAELAVCLGDHLSYELSRH